MKKKIISMCILIVLIIPMLSLYSEVIAFSGEIDPQGYIRLPAMINIKDNIGTGTISLSSSASGYSISYQKVDITQETMNSIITKNEDINKYVEKTNKEISNKETNINELKIKYEQVNASETATQEEKTTAKNNYDTAVNEYNNYVDNANKELQKQKVDMYAIVPNYTDSWQVTTNTQNNVKLDFSGYSGTINFVLWAKIDNGTNAYYNFKVYSSELKQQENNSTTSGDFTDFSNAKYELIKDEISSSIVEISGVTVKNDSKYYAYISSTADKPDLTKISDKELRSVNYDEKDGKLKTYNVSDAVELNQELYLNIIEKKVKNNSQEIIVSGIKLDRFAEGKYSNGFYKTFMTNKSTQIVTTFSHTDTNDRKMQIKVGKITDKAILNKIKNQDSSGFADLLNYAKSNSAIYDETQDADKNYPFIAYGGATLESGEMINLSGLENDAYYFLYVKTDDENGKYISNEAVTLAQADVYDNGWAMFFYGSDDFKWADFGNVSNGGDNTIAPTVIPKAGLEKILFVGTGIMIIGLGIITYKKYNKYQGI